MESVLGMDIAWVGIATRYTPDGQGFEPR